MFQERVGQWGKGVTVSWHRTKLIWGKLHPWPSHANSRIPWSWAIYEWVSVDGASCLSARVHACALRRYFVKKENPLCRATGTKRASHAYARLTDRADCLRKKMSNIYRIPIDKIAKTNACISILIRLAYFSLSKWNERTIVVNRKILPFIEIVKW